MAPKTDIEVAQAVRGEPLLSARVVSMANSVAVNPSRKAVTDTNGRELDGRRLNVEIAKPKASSGGGFGGQRRGGKSDGIETGGRELLRGARQGAQREHEG